MLGFLFLSPSYTTHHSIRHYLLRQIGLTTRSILFLSAQDQLSLAIVHLLKLIRFAYYEASSGDLYASQENLQSHGREIRLKIYH
jgi:hypothetical protein